MRRQTLPAGAPYRACRGVFLAVALFGLLGCVSPRDIRVLQAQLDEIQTEQARQNALLAKLDSLSATGAGSSRDMVVDLKHTVGDMDARLTQVEAQLIDLESRSGSAGPSDAPGVLVPAVGAGAGSASQQENPAASEVYEAAFEALKREDHTAAISGFRSYLDMAPEGPEAASAKFWIGESFFALGKTDSALVSYQSVVDLYPQSSKVPAALFKAGNIYQARGDKDKAYPYFRRLKEEFPQSLEYQQLRRQLEE
jgi:tol-pal system protein YbgF